jgi:GNAT superfamily N-acetyltransferase
MMNRVINKARAMALLLTNGQFRDFFNQLRLWLYSDSCSFGLRRDLAIPFAAPPANIPILVRPMEDEDIQKIMDTVRITRGEDRSWLISELNLLKAGIPTGYLATTEDGTPCYMQWLLASSENERINEYYRGIFPWLKADEALLEGAYTLQAFRGQRIMSSAMAQIAEYGREVGARWVITFVDYGNIASLKGCRYAGFEPYIVRREKCRFFRKYITFEAMSDALPYPLEMASSGHS